jgi:hypothetical protein
MVKEMAKTQQRIEVQAAAQAVVQRVMMQAPAEKV